MAQHAIDGSAMSPEEKPVILIADDSRVVRVSLKNILKNDCRVIEAEDGQQAWEQLLETPGIRLIFCDLGMPRLDGRALLQKIRNSEITRIRNVPFIVVTGNEQDNEVRDELQDLGATEMVSKPFDAASIVNFVTTLVSQQGSESYMLLPEQEVQSQFLPDVLDQSNFLQTASKELSFAIRNKNELAIALLHIDQFDQLSSHYSETAIEHILLTTAELVRQHIHPDDTMAYFGEGMFAMLRPASNAIGTRYIGRRIVDDLAAKQFYLGETNELVSLSIGISAPQIKPGIRLRELLLLAEGRLKAAMDLGGNRVIDKGNDTLTPVGLMGDTAPEVGQDTEISSGLHSDVLKPSQLRIDTSSDRSEMRQSVDLQELEDKVQRLQNVIDGLKQDNKGLEEQADRLRKQSGESEQLRRRIFELESEQQHMQLKLNDLVESNNDLQKRADETDLERQKLLDSEEERHSTLKQANQFYEQENLRLEGQTEALSNRAQKAELAYRKSEQLVVSLKDNIALLRSQMEHMQQQLVEAQEQVIAAHSEPAPVATEPPLGVNPAPALDEPLDEDTLIEGQEESDLIINGFPSSKPLEPGEEPESAPVIQLFADPSVAAENEAVAKKPTADVARQSDFVPLIKDKADISMPLYRPPQKEEKIRDYRPLSSFAIASLIMLLLMSLGGAYFYFYWQDGEAALDEKPTAKTAETRQSPQGDTVEVKTNQPSQSKGSAPAAKPPQRSGRVSASKTEQRATSPTAPAADEEARLEAELMLRQIAEEEFRQRLNQAEPVPPAQKPLGKDESYTATETTNPEPAPLEPLTEEPQTPPVVTGDNPGLAESSALTGSDDSAQQ